MYFFMVCPGIDCISGVMKLAISETRVIKLSALW